MYIYIYVRKRNTPISHEKPVTPFAYRTRPFVTVTLTRPPVYIRKQIRFIGVNPTNQIRFLTKKRRPALTQPNPAYHITKLCD